MLIGKADSLRGPGTGSSLSDACLAFSRPLLGTVLGRDWGPTPVGSR